MTTLVTADLHFSNKRVNVYRHKFVDTLISMLRKFKCDQMLLLGDLTEAKDEHQSELVNQVVDHIFRMAQICPVTILTGNHDRCGEQVPFFQFVDCIENVRWLNEPTKSQISHDELAFFLPHTTNHDRDWANLQFDDCNWIFCHQTFKGARGESGYELDGIPVEVFPDYEGLQVISGDVHEPQSFDVITYVGPPYTISFGDQFKPRVLLIENGKLKSTPCPGPQKRLLEGTAGQPLPLTTGPQINKGDILKVRIKMAQFDPDRWAKFKDQVHSWGQKHGYEIYQVTPVVEREARSMRRKNHRAVPDKEILAEYGKKRQVADPVLREGRWLMEHT